MEVSKLSKFKLKLQTLITDVRELREKESVSSDQLHNQFQKWKHEEEGLRRKIRELEAELGSSTELCQQLERKVQFLEDENYVVESKHKELKETINSILLAKEGFVKAYQESSCEMKRSIELSDRKIVILCDKLRGQLSLLESIRKEASSVKQLVDNVQLVVDQKEGVVARLKIQMDKVCDFKSLLIEKNNEIEAKLKGNENELLKRDRVIAELKTQLELAKLHHECSLKIQELQEAVVMKEGIIETLISENKGLRSELGMLEVSFKIVQDTMDEELQDIVAAYSFHAAENGRMNNEIHHEASRATVAAESIPLREREKNSESTSSSESQNAPDKEDTCKNHVDSECSTTTQAC